MLDSSEILVRSKKASSSSMASSGFIDPQIKYLLANSPLSIQVEQMWSGSKIPGSNDRFTLLIPFCLDYIRWLVIYNAHCPLVAPDVIFPPEDAKFRPQCGGDEGEDEAGSPKNSLGGWNGKDPSRLLSLILELREEYKAFQRRSVEEVDDERVKFEISTILSREGMEMRLSPCIEKPEEVKFAVPLLDMNINKMVTGCTWRNQQKIFLQVIYPVGWKRSLEYSAPRLKLVGSTELNDLFALEEVKLPLWLEGMCMAEYLPNLEVNLKAQIMDAISLIGLRRRFVEALATVFGRPVEADPIFCRKATYLAASGAFTFMVHFVIPSQFPKQQPVLLLQSSQHFNSQGAPIRSLPVTDYPWSPRWETSHMADRIFEFLVEECLKFRMHCNDVTSQH